MRNILTGHITDNVDNIVTHRALEKYEFYCDGCNTIHKMSMYASAQLAMKHDIVFTCPCGNKIDLEHSII